MKPFTSRGVVRMCTPPPKLPHVPQYAWLLLVYCHNILSRLEDVKARVTSVFGTVLKMDSTKKVTRKLAGAAAQTAVWAANVGNEHGQVLMSVLTDTETGRLTKGGISLPVYRCARGSTSLESFHLHLNRFIPGESANPWHFQSFLLEGLTWWNANRAASVAQEGRPLLRSYTCPLQHSLDQLSQRVLGTSVVKDYTQPREYTGELIGIEYLYSQTC